MIVGVSENPKFNIDKVLAAGFDYIESQKQIVSLESLTSELFEERLSEISSMEKSYIIISTCGDISVTNLKSIIKKSAYVIRNLDIEIYIENGMKGSNQKGYVCNELSDADDIIEFVKYANNVTETNLFGIAFNIGYANLLAKNIRAYIEEVGSYIKLVHINDNDGFHNDKQIPYTFTKGRGEQTTDWTRIIGALIRINYDGFMVFDTDGLFNRIPEVIVDTMLNLLANIAMYWLHIIYFEEVLDTDKHIILFGAGKMASNYLYIWGDKYKPIFLVDNNEKRWGSTHRGYEIKSPEAILEIPENERLVLICNSYYEEIGLQLGKMGVTYMKYNDNYYDFAPQ